MPVINRDLKCRIITHQTYKEPIPVVPINSIPTWKDVVALNRDCWYIGIGAVQTVPYLHKYIPDEVLKNIQTGSLFLLLGMEKESFTDVIKLIYEDIVIGLNIPPEKIIFVGGSEGFYEEVVRISTTLNKNQIKVVLFRACEHAMHLDQRFIRPRTKRTFKKKFLNFNRRWRIHRPMLVALLKSLNLLEYGYVSLAHSDDNKNWPDVWYDIIEMNKHYHCNDTVTLLNNNKEDIVNMPSLYLDQPNLTINQFGVKIASMHYYEESYFSAVTETNFFNGPRFLTEKIFKPVIHRHSFILASTPKSLEYIRSLGYKTFSPIFNEDYDLEENPCKRMIMIVTEIERLCNLSDDEWTSMLIELDKICDYNFDILKSKTRIEDYITFYN